MDEAEGYSPEPIAFLVDEVYVQGPMVLDCNIHGKLG
jgi:hypothetical protein